jgi:hypothetical protein
MLKATDWWLTPVGPGALKKTGACENFIRNGIVADYQCAIPGAWEGNHVYFSAPAADGSNLWRADLAAGRQEIIAKPLRITSGKTFETQPYAAAGGRVVFARQVLNADIWSIPLTPNDGRVSAT